MQQNDFLSRVCPVCGSKTLQSPAIHSEVRAESLGFEALVRHWNGFFKEKIFFTYARCGGCGLLYAPVFFNEQQLESLYGQMPPNMSDVPIDALRRTQYGYFTELKAVSELKGGFIEVGPDIGLFTENCVREGRFDQYWLFEPNRDVLPALSQVVSGRQFHVIHDMFGFANVPDSSASVAVMIQVLDHLLDPVSTLAELRRKLAPGAHLLLVTHDEASLLRRITGWRWPAFCLQHPQVYNPKTLQALLEAAGYKVLRQTKTVNYFQADFLLKHLLWAFGIKARTVPDLGHLTPGLKLGNLLTIATPTVDEK
ncbi:class I SAM-dependent methyltransferase [Candidatus Methylospira mobilis]|uniref:Class I SAM-dependent methyltransferase n=1 Tax=Candidatus Methylospira mobilis TaxID=1808979 RepID=A0A5Q0BBS4_9GAMM|nr:class I SAM-dependent methyltransferase [Candidatus Methylospira mobilis]QFY41375.1 class I SAM-dependent methyltransferase [Candidatus Methylospira mobilis]